MEEQDFLVRLVKRIEEEPSLYKLEDHNYSNDNVRHQAFLRIKDKLIDDGATEDQASVVTIRDKFRILKRRFSSEHRRKGAKSQWPFYQHLTFLIPCVEHSYEQEAMRNAEKRKWSMASSTPRGSPEDNDGEGSVVSVKETLEQSLNLPRSVTRRGVNPFNKDEEKVLFNADLQTWLRTHTCCGVKTKPVYDQIIEAIQMKEQGIVFPAHLERDYVIYAEKYELVKDEVENYVVYRKGKKVVHEAELFDILYDLHQKTAHSRRDVMFKKLNEKYDGISKNLVIMFLKTCRYCELNGIGIPRERSSTQSKRNGSSSPQNNFLMEIMRGADENQLGEGADEDEDYGPSTNSNPLSMFLKACDQNLMSYCDSPKTDSNVSMDEKNDFGEVMALAAYQLRQTYLLLRVVNDPSHLVVCKVNDEDYFPSGKVDHTVADRANWSPGQIVRAYFGFEQRPKDCVVESVGASEAVQDEFFKAKLKLTNQPQNPQRSQENGAPEPKKARTEPAVTARNGSLQSSDMRNIQNRFEEMEERLRFLEQQVFTNTSIPKLDFMGTGA